jgi:hypothetical protein
LIHDIRVFWLGELTHSINKTGWTSEFRKPLRAGLLMPEMRIAPPGKTRQSPIRGPADRRSILNKKWTMVARPQGNCNALTDCGAGPRIAGSCEQVYREAAIPKPTHSQP